jgi:hypothetical protein
MGADLILDWRSSAHSPSSRTEGREELTWIRRVLDIPGHSIHEHHPPHIRIVRFRLGRARIVRPSRFVAVGFFAHDQTLDRDEDLEEGRLAGYPSGALPGSQEGQADFLGDQPSPSNTCPT